MFLVLSLLVFFRSRDRFSEHKVRESSRGFLQLVAFSLPLSKPPRMEGREVMRQRRQQRAEEMSARSNVTITLGRSGQVIKRARSISDEIDMQSPGGKRHVRDRLGGNNIDSSMHEVQHTNKRQRQDNSNSRLGDKFKNDERMESNRHLGRDDLRLKLLNQSARRRDTSSENDFDLRHRLLRNRQTSLRSDAKQVKEPHVSGLERRLLPTRSADDLLQLDSLRKPYSSWTFEGPRHRSPDRFVRTSRVMSPPRGNPARGLSPHRSSTVRGLSPLRHSAARDLSPFRHSTARRLSPSVSNISRGRLSPLRSYPELSHAPSMRSVNAPRHSSFVSKRVNEDSRYVPMLSKTSAPVNMAKPMGRAPPPGAIAERSLHMTEELTVPKLLNSLGLERYNILFQAEEVDMNALKQMGENDLKDMGIPMGPRKKILFAVLSHTKQRQH